MIIQLKLKNSFTVSNFAPFDGLLMTSPKEWSVLRDVVNKYNKYAALQDAAKPFSHPDLRKLFSNNHDDDSIVFQRGDAILTIGDFKRLATLLNEQEPK